MTHVGHEALIVELLEKKPPGIMSADSTSSVCEQCVGQPTKALRKEGRKEEKKNKRQQTYKMWTEEGDELRVRR